MNHSEYRSNANARVLKWTTPKVDDTNTDSTDLVEEGPEETTDWESMMALATEGLMTSSSSSANAQEPTEHPPKRLPKRRPTTKIQLPYTKFAQPIQPTQPTWPPWQLEPATAVLMGPQQPSWVPPAEQCDIEPPWRKRKRDPFEFIPTKAPTTVRHAMRWRSEGWYD